MEKNKDVDYTLIGEQLSKAFNEFAGISVKGDDVFKMARGMACLQDAFNRLKPLLQTQQQEQ